MHKIILGNWKQNGDAVLVGEMIARLNQLSTKNLIGIFPPFVYLSAAHQLLQGSQIQLGAQNLSAFEKGAYTGELSAKMLKDVGCQMVLVGHSERRALFGETDTMLLQKFQQALAVGLMPVLCVGETLQEYEAGQTESVVKRQLEAVLSKVETNTHFMIAYEPVWAIGTGKAATESQAQQVHAFIRTILPSAFQKTPILYGGSVKVDNAKALMDMPDIDGVLVGGACLLPEVFCEICQITV